MRSEHLRRHHPHADVGPARQAGLRYTHFHSASLCSPTRAALITGRNHHSVHFGIVAEGATGYPGYDAIIKKDTATVGAILRDNGYATSWFGKDHNVPGWLATQAGPFDQWPIGMGFEYFYGFVGGDTSQWQPNLFRNTTPIAPYEGNPGWNLITAMADDAIGHIKMLNESRRRSRSSSTTCRAPRTRRTTRPRSGSTSSRASSTTATTWSASGSSRTRSGSA